MERITITIKVPVEIENAGLADEITDAIKEAIQKFRMRDVWIEWRWGN